ncbi:MAG TPA: hypothetical protein VFM98_04435 [Ramlibacter sp.]|uniref:hypothetical protein n=1 Tax=Ramlibacter sp. TaxID=1917967 RepID=UPI002D7EF96C|nr:hypothetical protein [Ramlibacter sp.]HET8744825.1 hypothetical protein [Ramlibacter sp.]
MKKTSLTRALFVAGVMAVAGGVAQADAIFYPDGTHVELGENAVENGLANAVLARSSTTAPSQAELLALGVRADQNTMVASNEMLDTTALGAGPATMTPRTTTATTVTTTRPVYVFPNSHFDANTVLGESRPMLSSARVVEVERTAMAPVIVDTTTLGAGPAYGTTATTTWYGPSTVLVSPGTIIPNSGFEASHDVCAGTTPCGYLPG